MRNSLLKLAVSWDKRDPGDWSVSDSWSELMTGMRVRMLHEVAGVPRIIEVVCDPGFSIPYHTHPHHDEHLFVCSGSAEIEVIKSEHYLEPGDSIKIPKDVLHRALYPQGAHLIISFHK